MSAIREATAADAPVVLALNDEAFRLVSPLTGPRLDELAAMACYFRVLSRENSVVGFLMAFRKGAPYRNANFEWFAERLDDFVYIDRVAIDAALRGRNMAGLLYGDIAAFVRRAGAGRLTCEVDADPPNARSLAFHDRQGFVEIGREPRANGTRIVSLREKILP